MILPRVKSKNQRGEFRIFNNKYLIFVSEGNDKFQRLTEINIRKKDCSQINQNELDEILSEIEWIFPDDTYKLNNQLNISENNCILHIYVALTPNESILRSQTKNNIGIVSKFEVEKQLNEW